MKAFAISLRAILLDVLGIQNQNMLYSYTFQITVISLNGRLVIYLPVGRLFLCYSMWCHCHHCFGIKGVTNTQHANLFWRRMEIYFHLWLLIWIEMTLVVETFPRRVKTPIGEDRGLCTLSQITKFMGPTWGPPGSCRTQMGPVMAPWIFLSGV